MENKKKLSTGALVALIVIAALNILWLISFIVYLQDNGGIGASQIVCILNIIAAALYVIFDYKRPHGNLMRYLLLFYACAVAVMHVLNKEQGDFYSLTYLAITILSTYMAGRLDRYKQNFVISVVVLILEIVNVYPYISSVVSSNALSFISFFACIGAVSTWLAISGAYLVRYKPHKEAGLADK